MTTGASGSSFLLSSATRRFDFDEHLWPRQPEVHQSGFGYPPQPPLRHRSLGDLTEFGDFDSPAEAINNDISVHGIHQCSDLNQSSQALFIGFHLACLTMKGTATVAARVERMIEALGVDQVGFARLAGASKSVVNQWLAGKIKSIAPRYAFNIQRHAGFNAEWVMLNTGAERVDGRPEIIEPARGQQRVAVAQDTTTVKRRTIPHVASSVAGKLASRTTKGRAK